ncbi:penicillin-binding protein activator [Pseudoduganella violaceinigra]|uniref:penicillin-binding protein activator n=1 Tax=Pseudoduganella violaceinigra TaxID=246602 RepID=UPI00042644B8|nr:penicillin-binding protein activator [Pseudoduganella violaceinigra]
MLYKNINKLILCAAVAMLASGCSTPCDAPGGLCAPITPVTSAPPAKVAARPKPATPPEPETVVETFAVPSPDDARAPEMMQVVPQPQENAGGRPYRIALLLPLRSEALGRAADALRAGFMAARERDGHGLEINVVETGDSTQEVLSAYVTAQEKNDMVVGPLARAAVTAIATSPLVDKPTIALNRPDLRGDPQIPPQMLAIGLSIEEEARQVAEWAARENPSAHALVISGNSSWQKRIASAIMADLRRLGLGARSFDMMPVNGYLQDAELVALRTRLQNEPASVLFAALDPDQARQLKIALSAPPLGDIPLYGTSSLNPGRTMYRAGPELDGVRLLDLPWLVQRDHPAVMAYPQPESRDEVRISADMERVYALGIDAFRIAREIAYQPQRRFQLDGVTGQLTIDFGNGPSWFERIEVPAEYHNGVPSPVGQ